MLSPFLLRDVLDEAIPENDDTLLALLVAGMIGVSVATGEPVLPPVLPLPEPEEPAAPVTEPPAPMGTEVPDSGELSEWSLPPQPMTSAAARTSSTGTNFTRRREE